MKEWGGMVPFARDTPANETSPIVVEEYFQSGMGCRVRAGSGVIDGAGLSS